MPPILLDPIIVQTKSQWDEDWTTNPHVEPISANIAAETIGQFRFRVRYGVVKYPAEPNSQLNLKDHTQINRQWIRCMTTSGDVLFLGRVELDTRQLQGPDSGVQTFTAYDGLHILRKIEMTQSVVKQPLGVKVHDCLLPFNQHPTSRKQATTPNRSEFKFNGSYIFENGGDNWRIDDAIEYLLTNFVNSPGQPHWTFSGTIDHEVEPMEFGTKTTAFEILRRLVDKNYGYSFVVLPSDAGYEIRLFPMAVEEVSFGTVTVPANSNQFTINDSSDPHIQVTIEESQAHNVGTIVAQGSKMVICRSFELLKGQLNQDWDPSLIPEYTAAHDFSRPDERFSPLWCRFTVNMLTVNNVWTPDNNPTLTAEGTLDFDTVGPLPIFASGMESLPLMTGNDYETVFIPEDEVQGRFWSPKMFLFQDEIIDFEDIEVEAELMVLEDELGMQIRTRTPHLFASHQYPNADSIHSEVSPWYRTNTVVITIAFESPQRLKRVHKIPDAAAQDGVMTIEVPDAEFWWLAKDTHLRTWADPEGGKQFSKVTVPNGSILRDDGPKLDRVMAGAIARYTTARGKANGTARGIFTWHTNLGWVLFTDDPDVQSVLTSVSWSFENGFRTTFSSGFAIE